MDQEDGIDSSQECAIAYYRHSAQDKQMNSIQIQAEQVRAYAREHGLRIVHEFTDRGRSGLTAKGRPGFMKMLNQVGERKDFGHVLVLDMSRWGRFQDISLFSQYERECREAGKKVHYVTLKVPEDGLAGPLVKLVEGYASAEESRKRSDKVFRGSVKVVEQGYRPGAPAPFGYTRALINERCEVDRYLSPGEKKSIANWRVKLAPGDEAQVAVILEIFLLFVNEGLDERQIAGILSTRGVVSPGGRGWSQTQIARILRDRQYVGEGIYNRTSKKLQSPLVHNPPEEWIVKQDAHPALVSVDLFERAQARFTERQRRRDPAVMLERLRDFYDRFGTVTGALLRHDPASLNVGAYARRFGSLPAAFQRLFAETVEQAARDVRERIDVDVATCDVYDDFLVLGRKLTVLIQPSVPVPDGYGQYWIFRPDRRESVDITLGVPLAGCDDGRILGYFPFPRLMLKDTDIRLRHSSVGFFALHGNDGLDLLRAILS